MSIQPSHSLAKDFPAVRMPPTGRPRRLVPTISNMMPRKKGSRAHVTRPKINAPSSDGVLAEQEVEAYGGEARPLRRGLDDRLDVRGQELARGDVARQPGVLGPGGSRAAVSVEHGGAERADGLVILKQGEELPRRDGR